MVLAASDDGVCLPRARAAPALLAVMMLMLVMVL